MAFKLALSFLLLLAIGANTKKLPLGQLRPYVVRFNLDFQETKIPDFIVQSLFATNGWITSESPYCDIRLSDILSIIPFKKTSALGLNAAIQRLDLQIEGDDITNFVQNLDYTQLSYMGFSAGSIYKNFVKTYLAAEPTRIMEVLNVLGIGSDFAMAYAFGSEAEMFTVLQKGDFSLAALSQVETIINAKLTLKDLIKIFGLKKLDSMYSQQFINIHLTNYLASKNIQMANFVNFLNSFFLELDDYKDMRSFKTCYKVLSQDVTLGVAVSGFEVITNDNSIYQTHMALEEFTTFTISAVQTKTLYRLSEVSPPESETNPFYTFEMAVPLPQYIEKATSYEGIESKRCTYVTVGSKKLVEQPTSAYMIDDELKISKTLFTSFRKGSPLICDGVLYGLAAADTMFTITFDTFEKEEKPSIDNIVDNQEFMQAMSDLFEEFNINPCDYFSCSPSVATINEDFVVVPAIAVSVDEVVEEQSAENQQSKEEEQNVEQQTLEEQETVEQPTADEHEIVEEQEAVGDQAVKEQEAVQQQPAEEQGKVEQQVAEQETGTVAANGAVSNEEVTIVGEIQTGTAAVGEEEQAVQEGTNEVGQEVATENQNVAETEGEQTVSNDQEVIEGQAVAAEQAVVQDQAVVEGQVAVGDQAVVDEQVVVENQAVAEEQAVVEDQVGIEGSQNAEEAQNIEESQNAGEPQSVEETQKVEVPHNVEEQQTVEEPQNIKEPQNPEESQNAEEPQNVEEARKVEEPQNAEGPQNIEEPQIVEEQQNAEATLGDPKTTEEERVEEVVVNDVADAQITKEGATKVVEGNEVLPEAVQTLDQPTMQDQPQQEEQPKEATE